MMKYKNIYVAASRQHVGKTTSTLGLVSCFINMGIDVGYCKPVGQKSLDVSGTQVDKDTVLFASHIKFDIEPEIHSPVILGKGATERFLDNPHDLGQHIIKAKEILTDRKELMIYEGTGHPGVGSIANVSNARVAKILDAGVILIIEGGIGSSIDMYNMCASLFREEDVPIIGVILNKVRLDKMDKVVNYVGKWLKTQGVPLLGAIPYDESLAFPLVKTVVEAIKGDVIYYAENLNEKVEDILPGSIIDKKSLKNFQNLLMVVSNRNSWRAIRKIKKFSKIKKIAHSPLSGIIISGEGILKDEVLEYIHAHKVPTIRTKFDTFGVTLKISRIEVKINTNTPWKVKRAIELIRENIDLDQILKKTRL